MTFREFLIDKLESSGYLIQKKEQKNFDVFQIRCDSYPYNFTVQVPKPGTRGYINNMAWALRKTAEIFMRPDDYMREAPMIRMIEEFETKEENHV